MDRDPTVWMDFAWVVLGLVAAILVAWFESRASKRWKVQRLPIDLVQGSQTRRIGGLEVWSPREPLELPRLTTRDRGQS